MKELTIEQKAQRYDEAINAIKELKAKHPTALVIIDWIKDNFPELAESEDERIRKALIDGFTVMKESKNCGKTFSNHNIPVADILAWLEKQGKQKSTNNQFTPEQASILDKHIDKFLEQNHAWSEDDERMYRGLHNLIYSTPYCDSRKELSDWLQSLKDRVQLKDA